MEMVGLLLWLVSGAGLLASIVLHINSYLMLFDPAEDLAILLMIGMFVITFPLLGLLRQDIRKDRGKIFRRYPRWVSVTWVLSWAYIFLNFIVILAFLNPDEPYITVRLFTGHSMGFYGLLFMLSSQLMSGDFPYETQ